MRKPFISDEHNDFFGRNGYLIISNFFKKTSIESLQDISMQDYIYFRDKYFTTLDTPDEGLKRKAIDKIKDVVTKKLSLLFDKYKPVISSYVSKVNNGNEFLKLHQNPTFVDERFFSSIVAWIPLQDVNINNGAMIVVPSTNRLFLNYRTANFLIEDLYDGISKKIVSKYGKTIEMNAGDILLIDDAILHASHKNNSESIRLAVTQVLIPIEAQLLYYHKENKKDKLYIVDEDFYERMSSISNLQAELSKFKILKEIEPKNKKIDFAEFEWLIRINS